jgi:hypothetical protein
MNSRSAPNSSSSRHVKRGGEARIVAAAVIDENFALRFLWHPPPASPEANPLKNWKSFNSKTRPGEVLFCVPARMPGARADQLTASSAPSGHVQGWELLRARPPPGLAAACRLDHLVHRAAMTAPWWSDPAQHPVQCPAA